MHKRRIIIPLLLVISLLLSACFVTVDPPLPPDCCPPYPDLVQLSTPTDFHESTDRTLISWTQAESSNYLAHWELRFGDYVVTTTFPAFTLSQISDPTVLEGRTDIQLRAIAAGDRFKDSNVAMLTIFRNIFRELPAPTNLRLDGSLLMWDSVANSAEYWLFAGGVPFGAAVDTEFHIANMPPLISNITIQAQRPDIQMAGYFVSYMPLFSEPKQITNPYMPRPSIVITQARTGIVVSTRFTPPVAADIEIVVLDNDNNTLDTMIHSPAVQQAHHYAALTSWLSTLNLPDTFFLQVRLLPRIPYNNGITLIPSLWSNIATWEV